ncbi:MAG TPA: NAD(P)-dependent oxidoreductase [Actinobacteria bacterium]|nr:NAD(P)-dependent oxidoreductase [Actinomycetota bacterium]
MPVIVVGADTDVGLAVVEALSSRAAELRAFVSDPRAGTELKARGIKTAVGDVSDAGHVGAAACECFGAVLVGAAAVDARERAFADAPEAVLAGWAEGLADAGIRRAIWVLPRAMRVPTIPHATEVAVVDGEAPPTEIAREVARLDDLPSLGPGPGP